MKIFLDVGAHEGQTLSSILDPKYSFDRIFVFEPVKKLHQKLKKIASGRPNVILFQYGLWNKNAPQKIYSPGSVAASLFKDHQDVDAADFELCEFIRASEWFSKNIKIEDEVYLKLNCEGAEGDILLDLLSSGELFKIKNVMIDFDVRKVKGLEGMEMNILQKFEKANFKSYSLAENVMNGPSVVTRIQNWLDITGAKRTGLKNQAIQLIYWTKMTVLQKRPGYSWEFKHFIKAYTPLFLLKLLGARRS